MKSQHGSQFGAQKHLPLLFFLAAIVAEEVTGDFKTEEGLEIEEDVQMLIVKVVLLPQDLPEIVLLTELRTLHRRED